MQNLNFWNLPEESLYHSTNCGRNEYKGVRIFIERIDAQVFITYRDIYTSYQS
jgi:hypothetical protein